MFISVDYYPFQMMKLCWGCVLFCNIIIAMYRHRFNKRNDLLPMMDWILRLLYSIVIFNGAMALAKVADPVEYLKVISFPVIGILLSYLFYGFGVRLQDKENSNGSELSWMLSAHAALFIFVEGALIVNPMP